MLQVFENNDGTYSLIAMGDLEMQIIAISEFKSELERIQDAIEFSLAKGILK